MPRLCISVQDFAFHENLMPPPTVTLPRHCCGGVLSTTLISFKPKLLCVYLGPVEYFVYAVSVVKLGSMILSTLHYGVHVRN